MVNDNVILTLLDDTDKLSVAEAMRLVLGRKDPLEFIANHQDDDNPRVRRHIQQLNFIIYSKDVRRRLVEGIRSHTLSFWDGLKMVGVLSDPRSNEASLEQSFNDFASTVLSPLAHKANVSSGEVIGVVKDSILHVPRGFDFFALFNLLLPDILDAGDCHPMVLCEILRQLGKRIGWYPTLVIFGGMYMLSTQDCGVLSPDNDWNVVPDLKLNQCHVCTNEELLQAYLGLLHVFSVTSRRPVGLFNFTKLLAELNHTPMANLPYPLGNRTYEPHGVNQKHS